VLWSLGPRQVDDAHVCGLGGAEAEQHRLRLFGVSGLCFRDLVGA
jgi:hypothetical protein